VPGKPPSLQYNVAARSIYRGKVILMEQAGREQISAMSLASRDRNRLLALAGVLLLVVALLLTECPATATTAAPVGAIHSAATAQAPQVVRESRFDIANPSEVAEVVQQVVSFPAGAWTTPHSHGGQAVNLAMDGEITLRTGDTEKKYAAGEAWSDATGDFHAAGNESGAPASLLTNFLLPAGATQTIVRGESRLQPQVTYESRFPISPLPANVEVIQQAIDFEPGSSIGPIKHGGQAIHIVVFGEITYRSGGQEKVYKAADAWQDPAAHGYTVSNAVSERSRLFTTVLLPDGMALTEDAEAGDEGPVEGQAPENAGSGLAAVALAATAGVLALLGAAFLLVRRGRTGDGAGGSGTSS
jgi:quercetin dioxygenase-like cupin family protein